MSCRIWSAGVYADPCHLQNPRYPGYTVSHFPCKPHGRAPTTRPATKHRPASSNPAACWDSLSAYQDQIFLHRRAWIECPDPSRARECMRCATQANAPSPKAPRKAARCPLSVGVSRSAPIKARYCFLAHSLGNRRLCSAQQAPPGSGHLEFELCSLKRFIPLGISPAA